MDSVRCRHGAFAEYLTACSEAQLSSYVSRGVAVVYRVEVQKTRKIVYTKYKIGEPPIVTSPSLRSPGENVSDSRGSREAASYR